MERYNALDYAYFPNAFIAILRTIFALMHICCRYKYTVGKLINLIKC